VNSESSRLYPSYNILFILNVAPYFLCVSFLTVALLFLLKKKSEGGISSAKIGVRSYIKMASELGFPQLDCKGVNEIMGLPISVDSFFSIVLVVGLSSVYVDASYPFFRKASR